jgi:hypothetical protein
MRMRNSEWRKKRLLHVAGKEILCDMEVVRGDIVG